MNRHPSSVQDPPDVVGDYMVQGHLGDCWRRLHWSGEAFYAPGWPQKQRWWKWKPVP